MGTFARFGVVGLVVLVTAVTVLGQTQIRPVSGREAEAIAALLSLRSAPQIAAVSATSTTTGSCTPSQLPDGSTLATQTIQAQKPVYDPVAANAQANVLWPGSLVQLGQLVNSGILSGIPVARTGGTVFLSSLAATVDPATGRGVRVQTIIPQLRAGDVETARIDSLSNPAVVGTAQFTAGFATFSSLDELAFRFNGSASAFGASFAASLNSSEYRENNNEAILFMQPIYTFSVEDFSGTAAFAEGVTAQALSPFTGPSNPMGFISSVTYGRMAVMTFSSSLDKSQVDDLVRASAGFLIGQATAENERKLRQAVTQTTVHLWVYGFPMTSNAILGSADMVSALKAAMADSGPLVLRSALPISYRANYLLNDTPAAINLTTQFPSSARSAAGLVQSVKIHFRMGNDPGDNKDWDTGLGIYLVDRANSVVDALTGLNRGHVRALATVPKGVNGEGSWQSGRDDIEVPLTIQGKLQWLDMNSLTLLIGEDASGADHIRFTPTVIATGPSNTIYRSTLQAFSIPSNQPGFPLFFPGDFGQVTAAVPSPPAPVCSAPGEFLRNSRAASLR
jgi:hypothetical protein